VGIRRLRLGLRIACLPDNRPAKDTPLQINGTRRSHRNVVTPFERKEDTEKLVKKLNQLISRFETEKIQENKAKRKAKKEKIQESKVRSRTKRKRYRKRPDAERRV
jgi:hypothetical protein